MDLDREGVIRLIEIYSEKKVLWDPKHPFHFNKKKKTYAWQEIADSFNLTMDDVKKKMNSLLGSFRREKSKGKKMKDTGEGAKEVYRSDWFALPSFSFLLDRNEPKNNNGSEGMFEIVIADSDPCVDDTDDGYSNFTTPESPEQPKSTHKKLSKPKIKTVIEEEEPQIEMAYKILQSPLEKEDSTAIYSRYIADKLNQFDPMAKSILIHKINNLIFEAEMAKFSSSQNPLVSPPSSSTSTPSTIFPSSPTH